MTFNAIIFGCTLSYELFHDFNLNLVIAIILCFPTSELVALPRLKNPVCVCVCVCVVNVEKFVEIKKKFLKIFLKTSSFPWSLGQESKSANAWKEVLLDAKERFFLCKLFSLLVDGPVFSEPWISGRLTLLLAAAYAEHTDWTHDELQTYCCKIKLATIAEDNQKAPFSIATTPRCSGGRYSFSWIAPLYPWYVPYIILCYARRYQVPFLKSLVWLDQGLNSGLPDH